MFQIRKSLWPVSSSCSSSSLICHAHHCGVIIRAAYISPLQVRYSVLPHPHCYFSQSWSVLKNATKDRGHPDLFTEYPKHPSNTQKCRDHPVLSCFLYPIHRMISSCCHLPLSTTEWYHRAAIFHYRQQLTILYIILCFNYPKHRKLPVLILKYSKR